MKYRGVLDLLRGQGTGRAEALERAADRQSELRSFDVGAVFVTTPLRARTKRAVPDNARRASKQAICGAAPMRFGSSRLGRVGGPKSWGGPQQKKDWEGRGTCWHSQEWNDTQIGKLDLFGMRVSQAATPTPLTELMAENSRL